MLCFLHCPRYEHSTPALKQRPRICPLFSQTRTFAPAQHRTASNYPPRRAQPRDLTTSAHSTPPPPSLCACTRGSEASSAPRRVFSGQLCSDRRASRRRCPGEAVVSGSLGPSVISVAGLTEGADIASPRLLGYVCWCGAAGRAAGADRVDACSRSKDMLVKFGRRRTIGTGYVDGAAIPIAASSQRLRTREWMYGQCPFLAAFIHSSPAKMETEAVHTA